MSKNLTGIFISMLFLFTACKKTVVNNDNTDSTHSFSPQQKIVSCEVREDAGRTARVARRSTLHSKSPIVLLLDFDGQQLHNTAWNPDGSISCPSVPGSLLTNAMKDYIFHSVTEDYIGFAVKVTKSEQEYQAAPAARRMRCILTYNMMGQFGNVGGLAFINSLLWGDNTPCFVFCDVMQYNQKYIAGAVSHELGHAFGLQHQARYAPQCTLEEEYHTGFGSDALGWAPIMGISYYQSIVTWHHGPSSNGCDQLQNDMTIIGSVAGVKADDYSGSLNTGTSQLPSSGTTTGILENADDKDAFLKKETASKRIKVSSHGNGDIALEVYNPNGQLLSVHDDASTANVNVVISGKKYLKVRVSSNQPFVPGGDGFGGYTIKVSTP